MNDPHVVALTYRVVHSETVDFKQVPPLTVDRGIFRVTIDAGKATIEMIDHFDSVQAARAVVDPFLRDWELAADLKHPEERFRFVYERSNVIDQSPSTSGARIQVPTAHIIMTGFDVVMHVGRRQWPEPPVGIALSPDVETLRRRWLGYVLEKEEKLLAAAYWALSMFEAAPGPSTASSGPRMTKRREAASTFFNIELPVLSTLGYLTSDRGGVEEGRKAEGALTPLSGKERAWVEAALKALVEQAARQAYHDYHDDDPPIRLTMRDLPEL